MELRRVDDYYAEEAVADLRNVLGLDPNVDDPPHRLSFSAEEEAVLDTKGFEELFLVLDVKKEKSVYV
ncbi:hypothetical protein RvY_16797 [Ramazzottius varieornatus]|uniref:Uncharacterized protein n=1 Tax=Ramazzottius varieornatus TaxID=947166 RepID=A0A1D1W0V2_RAMVA|nr:hypothetical protein RvY_16797 [Ramazzottius varieornatus]